FRVEKDGQPVALTPRAFDVLVFLVRNHGRVIEKQELFDHVWKDAFVSDNALTKVIKEIRRAIGDDANAPRYIETIPRRGYRLIAEVGQFPAEEAEVIVEEHSLARIIVEQETESGEEPAEAKEIEPAPERQRQPKRGLNTAV